MKSYLITTGSLFGLLTVLHVWRVIDERMSWADDRTQLVTMIALSALTAALSIWAFRLLLRTSR